jgi:DNA-binding response OmpR family regulator
MTARRVLVVDDQEDIREMAGLVLRDAGFEVVTAASGEEALRLTRAGEFDVVLLDINMPGLDGWSTLKLLRADGASEDLPVAMFSVKSEVRDKVTSLQDGAVDFIAKPFSVDDLVRRVARIVEAHPRPCAPRTSSCGARCTTARPTCPPIRCSSTICAARSTREGASASSTRGSRTSTSSSRSTAGRRSTVRSRSSRRPCGRFRVSRFRRARS